MIPEAAVEAAAERDYGLGWADASEWERSAYLDHATNLLEAAAPHMLAGVNALADDWEKRGEYDMAYSKTVADQDVAIQLLQAGAQMVDDARLVRNAIGATTEAAPHGND